jgi:hypothetical protein
MYFDLSMGGVQKERATRDDTFGPPGGPLMGGSSGVHGVRTPLPAESPFFRPKVHFL